MKIPVVENPANRKRRRRGTAYVKSGSGRFMAAPVKTGRRRRNPDLLSLGANPRRRKGGRRGGGRRYRNPRGFGGIGRGLGGLFDFEQMFGVGLGIFTSKGLPNFVKKQVWAGMPTEGVTGMAARLAVTFAVSQLVSMVFKKPKLAKDIWVGGSAAVAADLVMQGAEAVGLGGFLGQSDEDLTAEELMQAIEGGGVEGYVFDEGMSGYVTTDEGVGDNGSYLPNVYS